ncbi:MAG: site-2 protease family protein [Candidatus Aenigmarchaeota archaeon]|nr:site-2 protease family protein [Candidatus Aenigmarchaeota archaeon]
MLSPDIIVFISFIAVVAIIVYWDRKKIQFSGIFMMRRTKRGLRLLDNSAKHLPRFWSAFSKIAVVAAVVTMIAGVLLIAYVDYSIAAGKMKIGGGFVIPYPTSEPVIGVGYVLLPVWLWILAIPILMVPHEFAHGVISRLEKIRVKSVGWILLLIIPGAFVEPDEKQLKKSSIMKKLKIYSVGSFANFLTALLFFCLGFLIISTAYTIQGVNPSGLVNNSPAQSVNLSGSILYVNNVRILSPENISYALGNVSIGQNITVTTTTGVYNITTMKHPEADRAFIGLQSPYEPYVGVKQELSGYAGSIEFLLFLFQWLFTLTFSIGLVNLLPIKPLDGGLIFEAITGKFVKNESAVKKIVITVTLLMILMLGFFIFGGFLVK